MKFVQVASSMYFSSAIISSFIYPSAFVPLTLGYIGGVGYYELSSRLSSRLWRAPR